MSESTKKKSTTEKGVEEIAKSPEPKFQVGDLVYNIRLSREVKITEVVSVGIDFIYDHTGLGPGSPKLEPECNLTTHYPES